MRSIERPDHTKLAEPVEAPKLAEPVEADHKHPFDPSTSSGN